MWPLIGRTRTGRRVNAFAQTTIFGEGQDRVHAGHLQRNDPAFEPARPGRFGKHRLVGIGNACKVRGIRDMLEPGVGRI